MQEQKKQKSINRGLKRQRITEREQIKQKYYKRQKQNKQSDRKKIIKENNKNDQK